jgi:hypothetical protein
MTGWWSPFDKFRVTREEDVETSGVSAYEEKNPP